MNPDAGADLPDFDEQAQAELQEAEIVEGYLAPEGSVPGERLQGEAEAIKDEVEQPDLIDLSEQEAVAGERDFLPAEHSIEDIEDMLRQNQARARDQEEASRLRDWTWSRAPSVVSEDDRRDPDKIRRTDAVE